MPQCIRCKSELSKLLKFLERLRQHKLGLDWESKRELLEIENKTVDKIKNFSCEAKIKDTIACDKYIKSMVK